MSWISIKHTQAVALKLKKDLNRILFITDVVIQSLFIMYYTYLVITNLNKLVQLIVYSCFLGIAILMLIFNLICKIGKVNKRINRKVRAIVRWIKYPARVGLIAFSIYNIVAYQGSKTSIVLVILSILLLIGQILLQLIINFINAYIDYFTESLSMDYAESDLIRAIVNSRAKPKINEDNGLFRFAKNMLISKVEEFIEENKDTVPLTLPDKHEMQVRDKINKLSDK